MQLKHTEPWKKKKLDLSEICLVLVFANKTMATMEGGMICTNSKVYRDKLRLLRNLGFQKPRFIHNNGAYNFRMSGIQAALEFLN